MEDHHQELRHHVCKFCSKSFGCGRSLGGHMRSHMINDTSAQSDGSKITRKKLPPLSTYLMSNSNPNPTTTKKKKKRSKRRRTRYTGPANSSSISLAYNASSSASEVEQEQEEVALSLILLSRDVGRWVGSNSLASESSDEEDQASEVVSDSCNHLIKRKSIDSFDPEPKPDKLKKFKALDGEGGSIIFECTTCNKVFHSYQALGGHRASHKKTKGCFASNIDSCENSINTESSPDRNSDSNKLTNEVQTDQMLVMDSEYRVETSNVARKSKGHECPICLKVFPSGQALGGHKRAHLVGAPNLLHHQAPQEPIILDLNLPAPVEQESNGLVGFNPWWLGRSNHNCESLLGLIFN